MAAVRELRDVIRQALQTLSNKHGPKEYHSLEALGDEVRRLQEAERFECTRQLTDGSIRKVAADPRHRGEFEVDRETKPQTYRLRIAGNSVDWNEDGDGAKKFRAHQLGLRPRRDPASEKTDQRASSSGDDESSENTYDESEESDDGDEESSYLSDSQDSSSTSGSTSDSSADGRRSFRKRAAPIQQMHQPAQRRARREEQPENGAQALPRFAAATRQPDTRRNQAQREQETEGVGKVTSQRERSLPEKSAVEPDTALSMRARVAHTASADDDDDRMAPRRQVQRREEQNQRSALHFNGPRGDEGSGQVVEPDRSASVLNGVCDHEASAAAVRPADTPFNIGGERVVRYVLFSDRTHLRHCHEDVEQKDESTDRVLLGEGSHGKVVLGELYGAAVAIKELRATEQIDDWKTCALKEAKMMQSLRHPNLVSFFGSYESENGVFIVMELCQRTLKSEIGKPHVANYQFALVLFSGVLNGLEFMHAGNTIHRDLKPANILLNGTGADVVAKLTDFGLAKERLRPDQSNTARIGTYMYAAPEQWRKERGKRSYDCSGSVDMYSFSLIAAEVFENIGFKKPADVDRAVDNLVRRQLPIFLQSTRPTEFLNLLIDCTNDNPKERRPAHAVAQPLRKFIANW